MLGARGRLRVVERPLVEVEDGRPGLGPDADSELDGLGQDDLLFSRQERHARDLAEVQARRILHVGGSIVRVSIVLAVGLWIGLGLGHGRDVVDDGLELDLLELFSGHDRTCRLDVLVLGVVRELDQNCSVCERAHGDAPSPADDLGGSRPIRHGSSAHCRLRQVPDTGAGVSSLDTPA